jgi:hypothetical protein
LKAQVNLKDKKKKSKNNKNKDMIHYVDNLSVRPIEYKGVKTATFSEKQHTFCGLDIVVIKRDEFATRNDGLGRVDCPECLADLTARMLKPFCCDKCNTEMKQNDIHAISPYDYFILCLNCKKDNNLLINIDTSMKDPRIVEVIREGATYKVPTFVVSPEGIIDGQGIEIVFCKGNKEDPEAFNQEGVFTETLVQTAKEYLESVNKGDLATRETSMVITKLDEALMWIGKRADDRKRRNVQGTYNK